MSSGLTLISGSFWDFASGWSVKSRPWTDVPLAIGDMTQASSSKVNFNCHTFSDSLRVNYFVFSFPIAPFALFYFQMSDYIQTSSTSFHHQSENL